MSIWEFNQVKDSFFIFNIKPSFLTFVMYEKIFIPLITFVIMLFTITLRLGMANKEKYKTYAVICYSRRSVNNSFSKYDIFIYL